MKTYNEVANDVFARRDRYFAERKRKQKKLVGTALPVLAVLLIASATIGLNRNTKPPVKPTAETTVQTETAVKREEKKRKPVLSFPASSQSCYITPAPGTCLYFLELRAAMDYYKHSDDVEYVLAFDLFSKKSEITTDELEKEYQRLTEKGYRLYRCRTWEYQGENAEKVYRDIVVGVFTEEELNRFDVNPEYGYAFYFVRNGDSSPLTFDESTATPWTYQN
ncbi:MAG: hypothetical protein ACI4XE_02445 [Acutalibacteraceae bacterium]